MTPNCRFGSADYTFCYQRSNKDPTRKTVTVVLSSQSMEAYSRGNSRRKNHAATVQSISPISGLELSGSSRPPTNLKGAVWKKKRKKRSAIAIMCKAGVHFPLQAVVSTLGFKPSTATLPTVFPYRIQTPHEHARSKKKEARRGFLASPAVFAAPLHRCAWGTANTEQQQLSQDLATAGPQPFSISHKCTHVLQP